ncbi:FMN-binding glutamate synthase family protein, partial [Escherichia coli]
SPVARYVTLVLCFGLLWLSVDMTHGGFWGTVAVSIPVLLIMLGLWDRAQRHHAILRNYPVIGHVRWMVEFIRPEIR